MKHVVFAQFPDREAARSAIDDLEGAGVRSSRCHIALHDARPDLNYERSMAETDARGGFTLGIVLGVVLGALMGWLVTGPLHLFPVSIGIGILSGAALGIAIGFIGGLISGAMNPDRELENLESNMAAGGVVATVEVDGHEQEESIKRVFAMHGARQVDKGMIGPLRRTSRA